MSTSPGQAFVAAAALIAFPLLLSEPVLAQQPLEAMVTTNLAPVPPNTPMQLEADQLVYDYDANTVSVIGGVLIEYGGYTLRADRVTFDRARGTLTAIGGVVLRDPLGNVVSSDQIDVTDDFAEGFIRSLRIETADATRFSADSATRSGGQTIITNGVYTACAECAERPEKPPLWQVRAAKIIIDQNERMIYFEDASFEIFGVPVARIPAFWAPDPTVSRRTGVLTPSAGFSGTLGVQLSVPYYWAIAPNRDITFNPTLLSRQGVLGELEYRHRLQRGVYTIRVAGIAQQDGEAFGADDGADATWRGGMRTTGDFTLGSYWTAGWDVTLSTDRTFTRHYDVLDASGSYTTSTAYLTGMSDTNFFDARAYYFQILTDENDPQFAQDRQAMIHPVIDHRYTFDRPVFGGELSVTSNLTSLTREESDPFMVGGDTFYRGLDGSFTRFSTEVNWERQLIGPMGQLITPFMYAKADAFFLDADNPPPELTDQDVVARTMFAAGLEWRWPWMIATPTANHIIEPIAQIIARPDEMYSGELPNEDAQSLVLDDSNLFEFDKFSGFDRQEGGVRGNFGIHYLGAFAGGTTVDALLGQSIHLLGENPFASQDIAGTGPHSGLESNFSDIVARVSVENAAGGRLTARGLIDERDFGVNRGELEAAGPLGSNLTASASLIYLRDQTSTNGADGAFVLRGSASTLIEDNWRLFGSVVYDLQNSALVGDSFGLAYDDECVSLSIAYSETLQDYTDITATKRIWLSLQLRTLGGGVATSQWD